MRKKLLRSRSGFEKPESREEAIMQNILGASNVLEPSESNIEEILKSILYNTPYTKEAEFEIEKILLAIKNNGTYDGEGESRDTKILIAILNDLDYTEEAESRIEELFIEWLHQRSSIKVLEGVPPLTFTSRGLPLINYLIEGNTAQSGTPTPDNPIMPSECGERTGNLINVPALSDVRWAMQYPALLAAINSLPNGVYTMSISYKLTSRNDTTDRSVCGWYIAKDSRVLSNIRLSWGTAQIGDVLTTVDTFTIDDNNRGAFTSLYLYGCGINGVGVTGTAIATNIMLNSGSTALPYEPYGYKIPISSANTTTPVYLGEVETTRKIKKLVLTGNENWVISAGWKKPATSVFYMALANIIHISADNVVFIYSNTFSAATHNELYNGNSNMIARTGTEAMTIRVSDSIATTVADFKSYLQQQYAAGTPVTVWYVLATEETAVVNEPLMKIGDYADTVSKEQANVEIPTASGSNTLDVDTTVKPSNIYIEYK